MAFALSFLKLLLLNYLPPSTLRDNVPENTHIHPSPTEDFFGLNPSSPLKIPVWFILSFKISDLTLRSPTPSELPMTLHGQEGMEISGTSQYVSHKFDQVSSLPNLRQKLIRTHLQYLTRPKLVKFN